MDSKVRKIAFNAIKKKYHPRLITVLFLVITLLSSAACVAATSARKNLPVWPNNGIAQRQFFNGGLTFVENDKGKWQAWIISGSSRWGEWKERDNSNKLKGEVLNFFSGETQIVYPGYTEDQHSLSEFKTLKGKLHEEVYQSSREYEYITLGLRDNIQNLDFGSYQKRPLFNDNAVKLFFSHPSNNCSIAVGSVTGYPLGEAAPARFEKVKVSPSWRKLLFYYEPPTKHCPSGRWGFKPTGVMSLNDGTFLLTTQYYVFRLRFSDLSPVGSAPALYVLDADYVEKKLANALAGIDPKTITDQNDFLMKALNLINVDPVKLIKESHK
jgi:hypothetical protein